MEPPRELLVVLDPDRPDQALAAVRERATVTQVLPPRLALAVGDPAGLRALPGVVEVASGDLDAGFRAGLTEAERLFVDAWLLRATPKTRAGDGLSWDAPGFEPPDHPPHA